MPVRVGIPAGLANTPKADEVANTLYATAVGLAWAGVKRVDPRLNSIGPTPNKPLRRPPSGDDRPNDRPTDRPEDPEGSGFFPGWPFKGLFGGGDSKGDKTGGGY